MRSGVLCSRNIHEMGIEGKSGYRIGHMMPWEEIGGTEMATLRIAQAVKARGFESVMFCRELAPPPTEFFREANLETATYDIEHADLKFLRGFLYRVRNLVRELKQKQIDLVHCADAPYSSAAVVAARLTGLLEVSHVKLV